MNTSNKTWLDFVQTEQAQCWGKSLEFQADWEKNTLIYLYADDVNILGENLQTIRENTEIFIKASKDIGLEVNSDKTKYMMISR